MIIAGIHNPTVVSSDFFKKIQYIKDTSEIEEDNVIVTPAYSSIVFKNKVVLTLEPDRLEIRGDENSNIEELAEKYCGNLTFIRCRGIGINYNIELTDFDFLKFFEGIKTIIYKDTFTRSVEYRFTVSENRVCNIKLVNVNKEKAFINFNFDLPFNDVMLGEIAINFIEIKNSNLKIIKEFIEKINL